MPPANPGSVIAIAAIWTWLELGTMKLRKGAVEMQVNALEIPGARTIDLRAIRLTHPGKQ
ncbi:MAG: hypothetical protein ACJASX_001284 [Limisphaerales bacterium]|jgi:hypothetical protein